jgi:hypothetical protein
MNSSLLLRVALVVASIDPVVRNLTDCSGEKYVEMRLSTGCCTATFTADEIPEPGIVESIYLAPVGLVIFNGASMTVLTDTWPPPEDHPAVSTLAPVVEGTRYLMHDRHSDPGFWSGWPEANNLIVCGDKACEGLVDYYYQPGFTLERTATAAVQVAYELPSATWHAPQRIVRVESCEGDADACATLPTLTSWTTVRCGRNDPTCGGKYKALPAPPTTPEFSSCLDGAPVAVKRDWSNQPYAGDPNATIGNDEEFQPVCAPLKE